MELGELERRDGRWWLSFTRHLHHPPEKVWRALTEAEHLAVWFPTTIEGERAVGARLRFSHRDAAAPPTEGEMLAYDPPRLMELRWGDGETLRFELRPEAGGTVLTLVNAFDEVGKAARDAAGWHACLDVLAHHLDGTPPPWTPGERWTQVHQEYVRDLGPEAATIGPPNR